MHSEVIVRLAGAAIGRTARGLGNPRDSRLGSLRYKKSTNNFGMPRGIATGCLTIPAGELIFASDLVKTD